MNLQQGKLQGCSKFFYYSGMEFLKEIPLQIYKGK